MTGFDKKIKSIVKKLPVQGPKDELWESITNQLDFNEQLSSRAKQLPFYVPQESSWEIIEQNLKPQKRNLKYRNLIIILSAAASIALFIGIWVSFNAKNQDTITVTEETVSSLQQPFKTSADSTSGNVIKFIKEQCANKSYICNQPEYSEKKQQLNDVETQIKNIEELINTSGNSPSLIRTRIKLENMKARIMKDIINMITS